MVTSHHEKKWMYCILYRPFKLGKLMHLAIKQTFVVFCFIHCLVRSLGNTWVLILDLYIWKFFYPIFYIGSKLADDYFIWNFSYALRIALTDSNKLASLPSLHGEESNKHVESSRYDNTWQMKYVSLITLRACSGVISSRKVRWNPVFFCMHHTE